LSNQESKKKLKQELVQKEKKTENKNVQNLMEKLDELRKKGKYCDVAICPRCKSINLRRVDSTMGDMTSHLGWLPVIYECMDCGWRGRLEIYATNKKQSVKEVELMAEARDIAIKEETEDKKSQ
jgi:hypothetical protein